MVESSPETSGGEWRARKFFGQDAVWVETGRTLREACADTARRGPGGAPRVLGGGVEAPTLSAADAAWEFQPVSATKFREDPMVSKSSLQVQEVPKVWLEIWA